MEDKTRNADGIQHGIDDDPNNDAKKGAVGGGIGGAAVGAAAGSMVGPAGTVIGAVVGGVAGAVASGAAVAGIDRVDNDNKVSGVGDGVDYDKNDEGRRPEKTDTRGAAERTADVVTGDRYDDKTGQRVR